MPKTAQPAATLDAGASNAADADDRSSPGLLDRQSLQELVRELSVPSAWRSVWAIAWQWLVIGLAIWAAATWPHWFVYLAAVYVIGTRQHALGALTHEATHFRLFKTRWLNDVVSDLFCAYPIAISTSVFRRVHFQHHRYVNTRDDSEIEFRRGDEDWMFPKLPWQCVRVLIRDLMGLNCFYMLRLICWWSAWPRLLPSRGRSPAISPAERARLLAFGIGLTAMLAFAHLWVPFLLLWVVPTQTSLVFVNRVRSLAEHHGVAMEHELNQSRDVLPRWWERWMFAPVHVNYHLVHHLFPSVPFFNLPRLHRELSKQPLFRANAHVTHGYLGFAAGSLGEVISSPGFYGPH